MGHELLITDHKNEKGPMEWRFSEAFEDTEILGDADSINELLGHGLVHQREHTPLDVHDSDVADEDIITEFTTGFDWVNPEESRGGTELMRNWILGAGGVPLYLQREVQIVSRISKIPGYVSEFPYGLDVNKKKILWIHDGHWCGNPELSNSETFELVDQFVFVSNWQKEKYIMQFPDLPVEKCTVIKNSIVPIPKHMKPNDGKLRLYYASAPPRGLSLLVPAFEKLAAERDDIELHVFSSLDMYSNNGGRAEEDKEFLETYDTVKNHPQMVYHGTVSNDELREHIRDMHILAYPSTFQETSCIVAIEAMSGGCLAVVPDSCALHETCDNYGIMYDFIPNPADHTNMFYEILKETVNKYWSEDTQSLLRAQVDHFHRFYNIDDRVDEWVDLIESYL